MAEDWTLAGKDWKAAEVSIRGIETLSDAEAVRVVGLVEQATKEKKSAQEILKLVTGIIGSAAGALK